MTTSATSVLVVGAGPVGLALACALRRQGVSCRIIDAADGPTPPHESRALGIHARTLEVFDDFGIVASFLEQGRKIHALNIYDSGEPFARLQLDFNGLGTPYPFILSLAQGETQRHLMALLGQFGCEVQWRTRLTDLQQTDDSVTATVQHADGQQESVQAAWLVGCDGASSTVRHRLGLAFKGMEYPEQFLLADVRLQWQFAQTEARLFLTEDGLLVALPLPQDGCWRLIDATGASQASDSAAIMDRFHQLFTMAGFADTKIPECFWTSSFFVHRRAVRQLRQGRCFLAGDAAHIHSPVGGQGMNTGIQDAYNLAWKLARVLKTPAALPLLDSYQSERLPIAASVARNTHWATRIVTLRNPLARAMRNRAASWLTGSQLFRRKLTRQLSELGINYRDSPIVADDWLGSAPAPLEPGDRVPDVEFAGTGSDTRRLYDVLRGPHHTLLFFHGAQTPLDTDARSTAEAFEQLVASRWSEAIVGYFVTKHEAEAPAAGEARFATLLDATGTLHEQFDALRPSLYLVRPDGYLGYRACPPVVDRLDAYLDRVLAQ